MLTIRRIHREYKAQRFFVRLDFIYRNETLDSDWYMVHPGLPVWWQSIREPVRGLSKNGYRGGIY